MFNSFVLFLVLLGLPYITCDDANICKTLSPCSCMFPNGTGIDLSPGNYHQVSKYQQSLDNDQKKISMHTYYFFPCKNGKVNITDKPLENTCDKLLAICRHDYELDITPDKNSTDLFHIVTLHHSYKYFADNGDAAFTNDGKSIVYNNKPSISTVLLECAPNAPDDNVVIDETEPSDIVIRLYSKNACFKQLKEISMRSTGSTLLIIFFTIVLVYLGLGVCTKKLLMGAQGIEVIPNIGFWRDLPALCREGWEFARNGFRPPARSTVGPVSPNPSNYDSI